MPVVQIYAGLPADVQNTDAGSTLMASALLDRRFMLALLLLVVAFFVVLVAVFCVEGRRRRQTPTAAVDEDVSIQAGAQGMT